MPEEELKEEGTLSTDSYEAEDVFAGAEPWTSTETKLVLWSFALAIVSLVAFGILINVYILN
jgi:hypothetical protein